MARIWIVLTTSPMLLMVLDRAQTAVVHALLPILWNCLKLCTSSCGTFRLSSQTRAIGPQTASPTSTAWTLGKWMLVTEIVEIITDFIISGAAAHGDYIFGWKGDSLQKAMDNNCNLDADCPKAGLTKQKPDTYNACNVPQQAPEQVDGCKLSFKYKADYSWQV